MSISIFDDKITQATLKQFIPIVMDYLKRTGNKCGFNDKTSDLEIKQDLEFAIKGTEDVYRMCFTLEACGWKIDDEFYKMMAQVNEIRLDVLWEAT